MVIGESDILLLSPSHRHKLPIFCITASHFKSGMNSLLPIDTAGMKYGEVFVSCERRTQYGTTMKGVSESIEEEHVTAALKGQCERVVQGGCDKWLQAWMAAGGCMSSIYHLFDVCEHSHIPHSSPPVSFHDSPHIR